jgi:hypothetical protein
VSFTLDRYGHLFEGHDAELRDRLDAMHAVGLQDAAEGGLDLGVRGAPPGTRTPNRCLKRDGRRGEVQVGYLLSSHDASPDLILNAVNRRL